ncbi:hypothetical protein M9H77_09463 [Catharanthus roseus]|uniref:Uncharacterized protein n=1 Tax=Catharanthus roseus TaxID=4058 RepID=A0ACC0C145_CATRO|nr:hypothetical protein M9H77_09463 [Catharanthus roseus]
MDSQGPCFHCGTNESPLWIYGPTDKPVLCNACGTKWIETRTLPNLPYKQYDNDQEDPEGLLIFERINKYIPENEIGHGCLLLKRSQEKDSKMLEENTLCSRNLVTGESSKKGDTLSRETGSSCPCIEVEVQDLNRRSQLDKTLIWICEPTGKQVLCNACGTKWIKTRTLPNLPYKQYDNDKDNPKGLLIFESINNYIPQNEIGHGCVLLKPSQEKDSKIDDINNLKSEPMRVSTESTTKSRENNPHHPIVTRLRVRGCSFFLYLEMCFKNKELDKKSGIITDCKF